MGNEQGKKNSRDLYISWGDLPGLDVFIITKSSGLRTVRENQDFIPMFGLWNAETSGIRDITAKCAATGIKGSFRKCIIFSGSMNHVFFVMTKYISDVHERVFVVLFMGIKFQL